MDFADYISSRGKNAALYLYAPLKSVGVSAFTVVDKMVEERVHSKYPSVRFHALPHALHITGGLDALKAIHERYKTLRLGSATVNLRWSRPLPIVPTPKLFKVRVRGLESEEEAEELSKHAGVPVRLETYKGLEMGTHLMLFPEVNNNLKTALKPRRDEKLSFYAINFCRKCFEHFTDKPSLHKCLAVAASKQAVKQITSAPIGGEQSASPLAGPLATSSGSGGPAQLSSLTTSLNQSSTPSITQEVFLLPAMPLPPRPNIGKAPLEENDDHLIDPPDPCIVPAPLKAPSALPKPTARKPIELPFVNAPDSPSAMKLPPRPSRTTKEEIDKLLSQPTQPSRPTHRQKTRSMSGTLLGVDSFSPEINK